MNNQFNFKYTAPSQEERKEIDSIRRQYLPEEQAESKIERLRRLDSLVKNTAIIWSLVLGVMGTLIFGLGLTMIFGRLVDQFLHALLDAPVIVFQCKVDHIRLCGG